MHKDTPEISVIICTYNTKKIALECMENLSKSIKFIGIPVEVVIVENGTDGTGALLKRKYPWVKVFTQSYNTGFAKGNNIGISLANKKSKYYLFLNTDAFIKEDTLFNSIKFMESKSDCSALSCRFKFADGRFQPSAGYLPTPLNAFTWITGIDLIPLFSRIIPQFHPRYKAFFTRDRKVGWVMGAYLFMKNEVLQKTKGYDENFFNYMEEVDWCKRIEKSGFNVYYTPGFEITHLDKASSGGDLRKPTILEIQGMIYYMSKYYPKSLVWLMPTVKLSVLARRFAFWIMGNKYRSDIYREVLENI